MGSSTAFVIINSSDCTAPNYSFVITASTTAASALALSGGNDFVDVAHTTALNAYPLTVETWFKTNVSNNIETSLLTKYVAASNNGWNMFIQNGFVKGWYFGSSGNRVTSIPLASTLTVNDNNWHHAAFVVDASGGRIYIDGALS